MSQPAYKRPHNDPVSASHAPIYGVYTVPGSRRLWLARLDGSGRLTVRGVRWWKPAALALLALLWLLAALLNSLAT